MSKEPVEKAKLTKIIVTNITQKRGGAGVFLDPGEAYGNKIIGPGRSMMFDCPGGILPEVLEVWGDRVAVHNATDGAEVLSSGGDISPGMVAPVREMAGDRDGDPKDDDFLLEDEPDLSDARDALMPNQRSSDLTGPIRGDLNQMAPSKQRAKVSLGSRDEGGSVGQGLSPIPGDVPRDLDNSKQFTIKAPRVQHVGGVIGKK